MKRLGALIISIGVLFIGVTYADDTVYENAGTSSAQYLKIGVGARPVGMGESYAAISDDAFGIFWNPAGVSAVRSIDAGFLYNAWFSNVSQEVFALSVPFRPASLASLLPRLRKSSATVEELPLDTIGTLSIGTVFINMPQLQGADIYGNETDGFSAYNMVLVLSYSSRFFSDRFSWGANIKYIKETIETESATALCYDGGLLYRSADQRFSSGLVLQNIGQGMQFVQESFALPRNTKFGIAYWLYQNRFLTAIDINKAVDDKTRYSCGAEFLAYKTLALRSGWQSRGAFNLGMGFVYQSVHFDYAFAPYENLGTTHRASMRLKFDKLKIFPKQQAKAPKQPKGMVQVRGGVLEIGTGFLYGKVVDADNEPVKHAIIKISNLEQEELRVTTDNDGVYRTPDLLFGQYEVKAWSSKYEPTFKNIKIESEEGYVLNFKMYPPKEVNYIYGMIVDKEGKALKGAVVKVSQGGSEVLRVETDTDGTFQTDEIPFGVYEIKVWKQDENMFEETRCKVRRGKPTKLDFEL